MKDGSVRALVLLAAVALTACGPDVTAWKGTWTGSAAVNTGRQPEVWNGSVEIADGARVTVTPSSPTTSGLTFSCTFTAATADATTLTLVVPASCDATVTPADGCSYRVTLNAGQATREGDALSGSASGRVAATCPQASSTATDFGLTLSAQRLMR